MCELLDSHSNELGDDDLIEIEHQIAYDEKENQETQHIAKHITVKELDEFFRDIESAKQKLMDMDPNLQRSMMVHRGIESQIDCYRKIYSEKKQSNSIQLTFDQFLVKK